MNSLLCFNDLAMRLRELLESESYSASTVKDMEFILQAFSSYMAVNSLEEYTPDIGKLLIQHCDQELHVCASRVSRARGIVAKLNRLQLGLDGPDALWSDRTVIPDLPYSLKRTLESFIAYCRDKGNKDTTIRYKSWICGRFLSNLAALGCNNISELTGELVQSAFLQLGYIRYWERIGPFLRFLFEHSMVHHNYSGLIVYRKKQSLFPTVYSPAEISGVEKSIDRSTPSGIRNYAIILLLSRYGIRACDIAALSFENLDFENNRIHFIQQKTGDPWEAELFPEVKMAILDYTHHVRPEVPGSSNIFMTLMIPYKPIDSRIINTAVGELMKKSDISTVGKRHGSRVFRSSIASNMINEKVSAEVVRRVLGHGTKYAIKHYAKVDMESMRICPLSVPEPSGIFANMLAWKEGEHCV